MSEQENNVPLHGNNETVLQTEFTKDVPPPTPEQIDTDIKSDADLPFHETEEIQHEESEDEKEKKALAIRQKIDQIPTKFDVNKAKIQAWHDKYVGIEVLDENGEIIAENYKTLKEGKQIYVKARTTSTDVGNKEKEEARQYIEGVNGYIKELHSFIKTGEEKVAAQIKIADDLKNKRKAEKEQAEAAELNKRIVTIMGFGMSYVGNAYVKGVITLDPAMLKDMDEKSFQQFADTLKVAYEKEVEDKRLAEEEQQRKADELKAEQLKLEEAQAALKKQQEEAAEQQRLFQQQQDDFKAQQDAAAAKKKADDEKEESDRKAAEKKEADDKLAALALRESTRINEVLALGLGYSSDAAGYAFMDVNISTVEIKTIEPQQWSELIAKITPVVAQRKADELIRKEKEKAASDKKIADEAAAAAKKEAEDKAEAERIAAENKRLADEAETKRLAGLQPDKDKLTALSVLISKIEFPEIKDPEALNILAQTKVLLNKVSVYILDNVATLK